MHRKNEEELLPETLTTSVIPLVGFTLAAFANVNLHIVQNLEHSIQSTSATIIISSRQQTHGDYVTDK